MRSDHLLRHMKVHKKEQEESVEDDSMVNENTTVFDKFDDNLPETPKKYDILKEEQEESLEDNSVVNGNTTVVDKFDGNLPVTSKEYDIFKDDEGHWSCYYKDGHQRIYFNSFGCSTPKEVLCYLKTVD